MTPLSSVMLMAPLRFMTISDLPPPCATVWSRPSTAISPSKRTVPFVERDAGRDEHLAGRRIEDVFERDAPDDAIGCRFGLPGVASGLDRGCSI